MASTGETSAPSDFTGGRGGGDYSAPPNYAASAPPPPADDGSANNAPPPSYVAAQVAGSPQSGQMGSAPVVGMVMSPVAVQTPTMAYPGQMVQQQPNAFVGAQPAVMYAPQQQPQMMGQPQMMYAGQPQPQYVQQPQGMTGYAPQPQWQPQAQPQMTGGYPGQQSGAYPAPMYHNQHPPQQPQMMRTQPAGQQVIIVNHSQPQFAYKREPNHCLHCVICWLTSGLWLPCWCGACFGCCCEQPCEC